MKNKYITLLLLTAFTFSCEDESLNPVPEITKSSIPVFTARANDSGFINFSAPEESRISGTVDKLGAAEVEKIDLTVTFNNARTRQSETVVYSTLTALPADFEITFDQLIGAFAPEVVTKDTIGLGDSFVIGGNVVLSDGRYLVGTYSPSVSQNHPVTMTYNVACESDLAGTYDLTLESGNSGEASSLPGQTIAQVGPGYYEISDATMDLFGIPVKYRFTDICGNLFADPASVDYPSQVAIKFNPGTGIDAATGVITFSIEYIDPSCCGQKGIKTVFTATPR